MRCAGYILTPGLAEHPQLLEPLLQQNPQSPREVQGSFLPGFSIELICCV